MSRKNSYIIAVILSVLLSCIVIFQRLEPSELPVIKSEEGHLSGFAVYTADGDILYANRIENIKKSLFKGAIIKTDNFTVENPIGIIQSPPLESITNISDKALKSIDMGNKVLIIYIDGLGYDQYEKALNEGWIPFMKSLGKGTMALTVYPPITDVAFASMVTGETPKYTGIHSREKKPLMVPDIFDKASEKGKTSKVIEGNIKILTAEVETVLNIDENGNGTIDDEIYESAMKEIQNPPHILLVHFHSFDDFGHEYGPSSQEALEQLKVLDSYIEDMIKDYRGDIIITSDHGMHDEEGGGNHGIFCEADLFIPIIQIKLQSGDL